LLFALYIRKIDIQPIQIIMPSIPSETKVYILNEPPTGQIKPETFKAQTQSLPKENELKEGELLLKTIALSNDPAQRTWMQKDVDAVCSPFTLKDLEV
jgi:NADPH-dependent curcumin reductase CurA